MNLYENLSKNNVVQTAMSTLVFRIKEQRIFCDNMVHAWASQYTVFKWSSNIVFKHRAQTSVQLPFEIVESICCQDKEYGYITRYTYILERLNKENSGNSKNLCFMSKHNKDITKVNPFTATKCKSKKDLGERLLLIKVAFNEPSKNEIVSRGIV